MADDLFEPGTPGSPDAVGAVGSLDAATDAFEGAGLLLAGVLGGLLALVAAAGAAAGLAGRDGTWALLAVVVVVTLLLAWAGPLGLRAPGAPGTAAVCLVVGAVAVVGASERSGDGLAVALAALLPLALVHQLVRRPRDGAAASLAATALAGVLVVTPSVWLVVHDEHPAVAAAGLAAVAAASVAARLVDAVRPVLLLLSQPRRGVAGLAAAALAGGVAGLALAAAADADLPALGGLGLGLVCGLVAALGDLVACALVLPAPGDAPEPFRGPARGRAGAVVLQAVLPFSFAAAPALALGRLAAGG